jgi:MFS family permease
MSSGPTGTCRRPNEGSPPDRRGGRCVGGRGLPALDPDDAARPADDLWAPIVALAPLTGRLADRVETRGLLLWSSLAQAAIALALALALDSLPAILALATLLGCGFALAQPAEFALVPAIAPGAALARLTGRVETARYLGMTIGPLVGGALAAAGGTAVALMVDAATFACVAAAALLLKTRRRPAASAAAAGTRGGAVDLWRDPVLAVVVGVGFVSLLFMSASITAEVFFVKADLGASDVVYGLLFTCWTVGMVGGAALAPRLAAPAGVALTALVAIGLQGAGLGLPAAWPVAALTAAAWFAGGVGHGTKNVLTRTLIGQRIPAAAHGRAFAAYNALRNGAELVALATGGLLVAAIGARATLALAGGLPVLAAVAGLIAYGKLEIATSKGLPTAAARAAPLALPGASK